MYEFLWTEDRVINNQLTRGEPLMIWGGLGQRIRIEFFFPGQPTVEFLFFLANLLLNLFFPRRVAVEFFFPLLPEPPPPQIINGPPLMDCVV